MTERQPKYPFGSLVLYELRGQEIVGIVTHHFLNGTFDFCYHVKDVDGNYWHRYEHELKAKA